MIENQKSFSGLGTGKDNIFISDNKVIVNNLVPPFWKFYQIREYTYYKILEKKEFSLSELAVTCELLNVTPEQLYWTIENYCIELGILFQTGGDNE